MQELNDYDYKYFINNYSIGMKTVENVKIIENNYVLMDVGDYVNH